MRTLLGKIADIAEASRIGQEAERNSNEGD